MFLKAKMASAPLFTGEPILGKIVVDPNGGKITPQERGFFKGRTFNAVKVAQNTLFCWDKGFKPGFIGDLQRTLV